MVLIGSASPPVGGFSFVNIALCCYGISFFLVYNFVKPVYE